MREHSDADQHTATSSKRYEREEAPRATFLLRVTEGVDAGLKLELDGTEPSPTLVGQSPSCGLRLTDREVSRRHLSFEVEGQRLRITDLGSTNGTLVDGVAIIDAWISREALVRIGSSGIRIERQSTGRAPTTTDRVNHFGRILGKSAKMENLYPLIERLARSEVPIVIEGETGTGKEVLAEAIHERSERRHGPYVVLDCTTVTPSLAESELFGHERGAFTGAATRRYGVFEQAHGGTLFIDEIGDLELSLQPKLLRALERGEFRRVGGVDIVRVDVRVIAATRRDLDRSVAEGSFRDDLFHRLAVGRIVLPPLRKRHGDIALLARHFWAELAPAEPLPAHLLERWEAYSWPGNVRELRNAIARQVAAGDLDEESEVAPPAPTDCVERVEGDVETRVMDVLRAHLPFPVARVRLIDELQRFYVERALREHDGSVERAAESLDISRRYFHILKTGRRKR